MIVRFDDIKTDANGKVESPTLFIHTLAGNPVCPVSNYYNLDGSFKYNDVSEISFEVPDRFTDGDIVIKNPSYDEVRGMRTIRMEPFGSFILVNPAINDTGDRKIKSCKAYSREYELNYKRTPTFDGTYLFYDPAGEAKDTMMDIMLECAPNWKVGHIDANVATRYRTFDSGSESVYSFMMNTLQKSYSCIFLFDTDNRVINVYDAETATKNVPLFMSNTNLISNMNIEELSDEIVTCLSVYGANDVSILTVNPLASEKIYNLDYFISIGDIPKNVADKWISWKKQYTLYQKLFSQLFSDYYTAQIIYNTQNTKLIELQKELEKMKHIMDTYVTDTDGDHASEIASLKTDIANKEAEIADQKSVVKSAEDKLKDKMAPMEEIQKLCKFENFFTNDELRVLNTYFKEDSIQDGTYVVSYTAEQPSICEDIKADNTFTVNISKADLYRSDEYKDLTEQEIKDYGVTDEQLQTILGIQKEVSSTHLGYHFYTIKSGKISLSSAKGNLSVTGSIVNSTLSFAEKANPNGNHNCMVTFNIDSPVIENSEDVGSTTALLVVSGELSDFQYNNIINSDNQDTMSFKLVSGIFSLTYDSTIYQRQSTIQDLYNFGVESLNKLASPSYRFSVDSANFMVLPEFEMFRSQVKLGRSLNIEFKDGNFLQPILIGVHINFEDAESFDLEFSDKFQSGNPEFKIADMIGESAKTAASLDANKFSYSAFVNSNIQNDVENLINSALDVSKQNIINSTNQDLLIDGSGIHLRKLIDKANQRFDPCEVRMINNQIVFTDDSWETAGLAIGKITTNIDGSEKSVMGVVANSLIGNVIIGNKLTIEATGMDKITGQPNIVHFRVDGSGAFLGNAAFAMQGAPQNGVDGNQILIDPRYGMVMGDHTLFTYGSSGAEAKFLDESGNVIYDKTGVMPAGSSLFFDIKTGMASFRGDVYAENGYFKGKVEATSGIFKGAIDIGDNFKVDELGNLVCKNAKVEGNVTATSGSFTGDITTNNLTVTSGAKVSGLEVGKNITMGPDTVISWGNLPSNVASDSDVSNAVADKVDAADVTIITQSSITTGSLKLGGNIYRIKAGTSWWQDENHLMFGINKYGNLQIGTPVETPYDDLTLYASGAMFFCPGGVTVSGSGDSDPGWIARLRYSGSNAGLTVRGNINCIGNIYQDGTSVSLYGHTHSQYYGAGDNINVREIKSSYTYGQSTVSYQTNMYIGTTGIIHRTTNTSSRKVKDDIAILSDDDIAAENLYNIEVVQFKYKHTELSDKDMRYRVNLPGFIVEDLEQVYPIAVDKDEKGMPFAWNSQYMIPPMLKLIQDQKKEIDQLRADINELKGVK